MESVEVKIDPLEESQLRGVQINVEENGANREILIPIPHKRLISANQLGYCGGFLRRRPVYSFFYNSHLADSFLTRTLLPMTNVTCAGRRTFRRRLISEPPKILTIGEADQ